MLLHVASGIHKSKQKLMQHGSGSVVHESTAAHEPTIHLGPVLAPARLASVVLSLSAEGT